MNDRLNYLSDFQSDTVFFHNLLQNHFRKADNSKHRYIAISNMISKLKKQFNNNIKFILWDKNGKLDKKLSDITNYKYVLKIIFNTINKLTSHCKIYSPPQLHKLPVIEKKINLLRKVLGRFLIPGQMAKPLQDSYLGSCIKSSSNEENGLLWFQTGKNFSIVCFIAKSLLNKDIPSKLQTYKFNINNIVIKLGAYNNINNRLYGMHNLPEVQKQEILIEAEKYKQTFSPFIETKNFLLLFRQTTPELIVFSYLLKQDHIEKVSKLTSKILAKIIQFICIVTFILFCYSLRKNIFNLSIKQQLISLFLFVNLVSLLTIVSTSYKFFDYKRVLLINDIQEESFRTLNEINKIYKSSRKKIAQILNNFVNQQNQKFQDKKWSKQIIREFEQLSHKLLASELLIRDIDGKSVSFIDKHKSFTHSKSFRRLHNIYLDFANKVPQIESEKKYAKVLHNLKYNILVHEVPERLGKIEYSMYGMKKRWTYLKLLGNPSTYNNWGISLVGWGINDLQKSFFARRITTLNKDFSPRKIITMTREDECIFPNTLTSNKKIKSILHRSFTQTKILDSKFTLNNKQYIAYALAGDGRLDASMMVLFPRELVERKILNLKILIFGITALCSIMLLAVAWFFLKALINPISELGFGISQIQSSNFDYRIDNIPNDEIGDLGTLLNESMESMKTLSVGTAVQKSLLPDKYYNNSFFNLYADSVFMTTMGGDYFDYFIKSDKKCTLLFGDVAGHGIPAGIVMGMMKAIALSSKREETSPLDLIKKANNILLTLKATGWRGSMTFQSIDFNYKTGELIIANAGHCYPMIISPKGEGTRLIKVVGTPLGNRMSRRAIELTETLLPGETLLLYSDGFIEALSETNTFLGYEGFAKLVMKSWSKDIKEYWKNIFNGYKKWATEQDDDITFMLVRRK